MKRILSIALILCLTLGIFSVAHAAIKITQQPTTQTVKAGDKVTFKVKATGVDFNTPVTWYFTNPETGETITGKKLSKAVPVKVQNPNSLSITLKKVPEAMHGWTLYCRVGPKSGGKNSDTVMILIAGKEVPGQGESGGSADSGEEADGSGAADSGEEPEDSGKETADSGEESADSGEGSDDSGAADTGKEDGGEESGGEGEGSGEPVIIYVTPEPVEQGPIVITGSKVDLYNLDKSGNMTGSAQKELTFETGSADFYVKVPDGTEGTLEYFTIGGVKLAPEGDVAGMSVRGWQTSATVRAKILKPGAASAVTAVVEEEEEPVDESSLVTVTCVNCRFTGWHNTFAETGKVPVGTTIIVAASGGMISKGYVINGAKADYKNLASFQYTVNEDTTIEMEEQKSSTKPLW